MTLVGLKDEDLTRLPIMLSVHQQQHHGLLTGPAGPQSHRGNVIVSTSSVPGSIGVGVGAGNHEIKMHGCKRSKIYAQSSPYGTLPHQPASVARRNARERNRVKQVNNGFATLRQHIPQSVAQALGASVSTSPTPAAAAAASNTAAGRAASKKLSKVETLRMAVEYIRSLQRLLDEHDGTSSDTGTMTSSSSASSPSSSCSSSSSSSSSSTSTSPASSNTDSQLDLITDGGNHHHRHHLHHHHHHHHHSHHNDHHHQQQQQQQQQQQMRLIGSSNGDIQTQTNELHVQLQRAANVGSPSSFVAAPCSEASSSPTPSFVSDASSAGSQGYGGGSGPTSGTTTSIYASHSDSYDNYEPMSPEDEELLDVISWWQQSQ